MKKYIILLLVCITVVLSVSAVGAGLFGDDVTVKEVVLFKYNEAADKQYHMGFNMAFVSNKDMSHIRNIELQNVKISFGKDVRDFPNVSPVCNGDLEDNNADIAYNDMMIKNNYYTMTWKYTENSIDNRNDISHIKADIVMNTTTENNVVIGHIDQDISMSTVKKPTGNYAQYNF